MRKMLAFLASAAISVSACAVSMDDEKYNLNFIYAMWANPQNIFLVDALPSPAVDTSEAVKSVSYAEASTTLDWAIKNQSRIHSAFWGFYRASKAQIGATIESSVRGMAVVDAINKNNAAIQTSLAAYLDDVRKTAQTSKDDIEDLLGAFGVTAASDIANSTLFKQDQKDVQENTSIEVGATASEMTALQNAIAKNEGNISENTARLSALETKLIQFSLSTAAAQAGMSLPYVPLAYAPVSTADRNYTNMVKSLCAWLGAVDGGSVTNNGMTFAAPAVDGEETSTLFQFLDKNGVIGYTDNLTISNSQLSVCFAISNSVGSQVVTAPFGAPENWVDGTTIRCTNGVYSAYPTYAWNYRNGRFNNANVFVGSQVITPSNTDASSTGNWYCHVVYANGAYTATISQESIAVSNDEWVFLVGTLETDGEGNTYATYELATTPIILCYE